MNRPVIHSCEVRHGSSGARIRILASREKVYGEFADFDLLAITEERGKVTHDTRGSFIKFPRALGAEGIFASILSQAAAREGDRTDETGTVVPLPARTPEEWLAIARDADAQAAHARRMFMELTAPAKKRRKTKASKSHVIGEAP